MLQLKNIKKDYTLKGQEPVHALKGISLTFRQNEFVAILGPSGCGKTTLLNIIGGLDRYTSGDLVIEGTSTKQYKDRDWDTYRNHSVGFVFQSYNLIGHQNILKNVELALTISGISKKERKQRALDALERVGLKDHAKKRPNQLSGGQMQRVAIARALVNNPEILLADEPTGALDSTTSVQIMDLLKEVAKDRLVVMVTHNPDLAYAYANRIVKMFDGEVQDDSNPFTESAIMVKCPKCGATFEMNTEKPWCPSCGVGGNYVTKKNLTNKGNKKQTSMSFWTALGLSFANLVSKSKRTVLVAVAGSIGIVGVSSVLAVSSGVKNYINGMQDDMLSSYPITITEESVDYTSLMEGLSNLEKEEQIIEDGFIGLDSMIAYLMDKYEDITSVKTNTIDDNLVQFIKDIPSEYLSAMNFDYGIDVTNNIFTDWQREKDGEHKSISLNGLTQMYIAELKTVDGFSEYARYVDLFTDFMKQLPGEEEYLMSQYDLLDGHFANEENEIMLVVDKSTTLTDVLLAQLGFYNQTEFLNIAKRAIEENKETPDQSKIDSYTYPKKFSYQELLGKKLTYYPHQTIWDKATITVDYNGMPIPVEVNAYSAEAKSEWENGVELKIAGILRPKETINFGSLSRGIFYNKKFGDKFMNDAANSDIVKGPSGIESYIGSTAEEKSPFTALVTFEYTDFTGNEFSTTIVPGYASALNADLSTSISSLFSSMSGGINYNELDLIYLRSLSGLAGKQIVDDSGAIQGYTFNKLPKKMSIYPKDFDLKDKVLDYLDSWNLEEGSIKLSNGVSLKKENRDELTYTDTLSLIVTAINTLIDAITIALVSFTSLALVVSCFMIAVITYISVMERVKEIGVIRSLGGRKKDVSRLFIAETFIIGLFSGFIGIGITYILSAILNIIVLPYNVGAIAALPLYMAGLMVVLSFALTVLSGLIPSQKASRQDPVIALRSE